MANMKKPATPKKPAVKRPSAKPVPMPKKTLTGPNAIKEIQRQVSPKGVKKAESETILVAEQLNDGSGAIASARSRADTSMMLATRGFG